jgi:endonuclease/exonuclease/phosphatase family metal-dependent hydrolase
MTQSFSFMRPVVVLALAAGLGLATTGCGERPLEPRDPTPGVPHYKIKTYNVEAGGEGHASTIQAIGTDDADVVCLQETTPQYETKIREKLTEQYPYQLYQHNEPDQGSAGMAVLSHFPIIDGGWHPGPNGWHPAWHLFVQTPAGTIQILNVHLRSMFSGNGNSASSYLKVGEDHLYEISLFMKDCAHDYPTLVVGDFNESPSGRAVEYLEDRGFRNALPLFRPGQFTWRHPSVANQMSQTLDHILFDDSFSPLDAWAINAGASDHIPVVAHLEAAYDWQPDTSSSRAATVPEVDATPQGLRRAENATQVPRTE